MTKPSSSLNNVITSTLLDIVGHFAVDFIFILVYSRFCLVAPAISHEHGSMSMLLRSFDPHSHCKGPVCTYWLLRKKDTHTETQK